MRQLAVRLADAARAAGGARIAWVAPRWLLRREFLIFTRDLAGALPPVPAVEGLRWSLLAEADVGALRALDPSFAEESLRLRLGEGQECRLGWLGGTLAHFRWDAYGPTRLAYLGLTLLPLAGDAVSGYGYTRPGFRGRGLHTAGYLEALHRARGRGLTRSISLVAAWNRPGLRVSGERAGGVAAGRVGFWSFGVTRRHFSFGAVSIGPGRVLRVLRR